MVYCMCPSNKAEYNKCSQVQKPAVKAKMIRKPQKVSSKIEKMRMLNLLDP